MTDIDSILFNADAIRRRFASFDGVDDLMPHPPVTISEPPVFDEITVQ